MTNKVIALLVVAVVVLSGRMCFADMLVHYKFDETAGTSVGDSSGNLRNGTLSGMTSGTYSSWSAGLINNCCRFSIAGTTYAKYITQPGIAGAYNEFTMAMWVYPESTTRKYLYYEATAATGAVRLQAGATTGPRIFTLTIFDGLSPVDYVFDGVAVPSSAWSHVAFVYDGPNSQVKFYLNGMLQQTLTISTALSAVFDSGTVYIGNQGISAANAFPCRLDDFRIYDAALADAEVKSTMALVDIEGNDLPPGAVASAPNKGSLGGTFSPSATGGPCVDAVAGKKAMQFTGNGYLGLDVPPPARIIGTLTGPPVYTHIAWLYRPDLSGGSQVFLSWAPYDRGALWQYGNPAERYAEHGTTCWDMWWDNGSGGGTSLCPAAGAWHSLVTTCDGTTEILYVDGSSTPVLSTALAGDKNFSNADNYYPLLLGAYSRGTTLAMDRTYNGAMASAQVFPIAIPADYIAAFAGAIAPVDAVVHTIIASTENGLTITPSGAVKVLDGASRTFAITPSTGNSVTDVLVDGRSVGAVATYTFTDVAADHTIRASSSSGYVDVANFAELEASLGQLVRLTEQVEVVAKNGSLFFIGEERLKGCIKVTLSGQNAPSERFVANLVGVVTADGPDQYALVLSPGTSFSSTSGDQVIKPVGMNIKAALTDAKAVRNLITVWGNVVGNTIDDGYGNGGLSVYGNLGGGSTPVTGVLWRQNDATVLFRDQP